MEISGGSITVMYIKWGFNSNIIRHFAQNIITKARGIIQYEQKNEGCGCCSPRKHSKNRNKES